MNAYIIGKRLKLLMQIKDIKRSYVAKKLNMSYNTITKKLFKENGLIRMIDIIELIDLQNKIGMQEFYIEYYREKKQKETIENNKQSLDSLKRELINLMTQKEILEAKISTLLEQINTIEGEKTINGRK